jgi:hypothetical protein
MQNRPQDVAVSWRDVHRCGVVDPGALKIYSIQYGIRIVSIKHRWALQDPVQIRIRNWEDLSFDLVFLQAGTYMKERTQCAGTNQFQTPATHAHWFPAPRPVPYSSDHPSAAVPIASLHG